MSAEEAEGGFVYRDMLASFVGEVEEADEVDNVSKSKGEEALKIAI